MTKEESKDMWKSAFATALFSGIVTVALGAVLWYAVIETRMAVVEHKSKRNEETIQKIADDYVKRQDIIRIEGKLDALILALTKG